MESKQENFSGFKVPELKALIKARKLGAISGKTKAQLLEMLQPKQSKQSKKSGRGEQRNKTVVNVYVSGQQSGQIPLVTQTQQGGTPQIIKPNFKISSKEPAKKFNTVRLPTTDPTKPISASFSKASKPSSSSVGKLNLNTDFANKLAGLFA